MPQDLGIHALTLQDVEALIDVSLELWNTGDSALAPRVYAPHSRYHQSGQPSVSGPDGVAAFVAELRRAFPDLLIERNQTFVNGDRFAVSWTFTAIHEGAFLGVPPSGRPIRIQGVSLGRIVDNLIEETTVCYDRLSFLEQVGAIPAPPPQELAAAD